MRLAIFGTDTLLYTVKAKSNALLIRLESSGVISILFNSALIWSLIKLGSSSLSINHIFTIMSKELFTIAFSLNIFVKSSWPPKDLIVSRLFACALANSVLVRDLPLLSLKKIMSASISVALSI